MRHKLSLFDYFHIVAFIMFITFTTVFIGFIAYKAHSRFEKDAHKLQTEYLASKKHMLENEVGRFVDYIDMKKAQAYTQTQNMVQRRVYEAHRLASDLYAKYKDTPIQLISAKDHLKL